MVSVPLGCPLPLQTLNFRSQQQKLCGGICCCASTASTPHSVGEIRSSTETATGSFKPIVVSGDPPTFVSAPGRRIVAVGDLHGDVGKARYALQMAGVLSDDGQDLWVGGQTVLVQLGDILDRGEDEIAILSLLKSLDIQAKANGGAVFQVNGNHETMNVEGDFRYVDSGGFDECADFLEHLEICDHNWEEAFLGWAGVSTRWKKDLNVTKDSWGPWNLVKRQKGVIARSILLRPGGPLASELARHAVVLKVNDWVFCHGGLLPHHGKGLTPTYILPHFHVEPMWDMVTIHPLSNRTSTDGKLMQPPWAHIRVATLGPHIGLPRSAACPNPAS